MPITTSSKRRSLNLTISADVIDAARELKLNASEAAEVGLRLAIAEKRAEYWVAENQSAIDAHNNRVEKEGTLLTPDWVK